jgi:hypothetical protein
MLAIAATLLPGCKLEQILIGQWYTLYTPPAGACPALTWQFEVNPQRAVTGFLAGERQQRIATLSGVLNPDDSFRMTATGVSGPATAEITGQFGAQISTISIHGEVAGAGCDGRVFVLRLGGYFARAGGGGGGGG